MTVKMTGLPEIIRKMRKAFPLAGKGVERGLKRGGLLIHHSSLKQVPVDTGILRASGFTRKVGAGSGFDTDVQVGYTAAHGIYVHEDKDALHGDAYNLAYAKQIADKKSKVHNRGSGQKAKFLEDPARAHMGDVVKLVVDGVDEELRKL